MALLAHFITLLVHFTPLALLKPQPIEPPLDPFEPFLGPFALTLSLFDLHLTCDIKLAKQEL